MPTYNFVLGAQVCTEANMDASKKDLSEEQRVELEVSIRPNRNIIMIISKSYNLLSVILVFINVFDNVYRN